MINIREMVDNVQYGFVTGCMYVISWIYFNILGGSIDDE